MRSTIGISRKMPGPFGCGRSRPRRKITPRSYSRAILTAAKRNSKTMTSTTTIAIPAAAISALPPRSGAPWILRPAASPPRHARLGRGRRGGAESRPRGARARARRSPAPCPSRRTTPSSPTSPCTPTATGLRAARTTRVSASPSRTRKRAGDRERDGKRHLVRVAGRIEEHERSEDEQDRAGERERRRASERTRRRRRMPRRGSSSSTPGERDGEHLQAVEPEDQRDRADRSREDRARDSTARRRCR